MLWIKKKAQMNQEGELEKKKLGSLGCWVGKELRKTLNNAVNSTEKENVTRSRTPWGKEAALGKEMPKKEGG